MSPHEAPAFAGATHFAFDAQTSPSSHFVLAQSAPAPARLAHAPQAASPVMLHERPAHCASSPQGVPSASVPAGVLHASGSLKISVHDAELYAPAHVLTTPGVSAVEGAPSAFRHWLFWREMHSFASLYEILMKTGKHSASLLQNVVTYWSQAPSGDEATPPEELLLHATSQTAVPSPMMLIARRIMTAIVDRRLGCTPDMRLSLAALLFCLFASVACERADRDRVRPCGYDDEESNDVAGQAWDFGSFANEPNSLRERTATIHSSNDVDWYRATVYRRALGTDPLVTVVAPAGFRVTAYHSCVGAGTPVDCVWGRPITDENGMGCESVDGPESVIRAATHCNGDQSNVTFKLSPATTAEDCRKYDVRFEVE